jgi:hypothetical protein
VAAAGCRSLTYGLSCQRWKWLYSVEPVAPALCHIERFVVLGATPSPADLWAYPITRASNGANFSSVEIAEVIKISE